MKVIIALCLLALAAVATAETAAPADNHSVDEILNNRRLLLPYIKCALEQGKCTADGKRLRAGIKEAFETDCSTCNEEEKKEYVKVFQHLIKKENDFWKQLAAKYDPENKRTPEYEKKYGA